MKIKFTGWVEKVGELGSYDRELIVREKDTVAEGEYNNYITFTVRAKNDDKVATLAKNAKVEVDFFLTGMMGVSKKTNKPYNINRLVLADVRVLQEAPSYSDEEPSSDTPNGGELPF